MGQSMTDNQSGPPPPDSQRLPPQGPIDDFILPALFFGIVLGIYFLYKNRKTINIRS